MKKEIPIVKRKFLLQQSTKTMSKDIPEFYRSILEASDRGELWGISSEKYHWRQLEIDLNSCMNSLGLLFSGLKFKKFQSTSDFLLQA